MSAHFVCLVLLSNNPEEFHKTIHTATFSLSHIYLLMPETSDSIDQMHGRVCRVVSHAVCCSVQSV